jgi:hypothetical protein
MQMKPHQERCEKLAFAIKEGWIEQDLLQPRLLLRRAKAPKGKPRLLMIDYCPFCGWELS